MVVVVSGSLGKTRNQALAQHFVVFREGIENRYKALFVFESGQTMRIVVRLLLSLLTRLEIQASLKPDAKRERFTRVNTWLGAWGGIVLVGIELGNLSNP